jgi:hypothetical protein
VDSLIAYLGKPLNKLQRWCVERRRRKPNPD